MILQFLRLVTLVASILAYLVCSLICALLIWNKWKRTAVTTRILSAFCRLGVRIVGGKVTVIGEKPSQDQSYMVVSNHLSYMDILVVSSLFPTCYVTSVEMKETPVLGQLAIAANSLFVERRSRSNLMGEIQELTDGLSKGLNVTVFPEATSTNGDCVIRFRRPLYSAAINSGVTVLPICINYRKVKGETTSIKNRDFVFWYGDMTFIDHLWGLLSGRRTYEVEVTIMEPVSTEGKEAAELAEMTHKMVSEKYTPMLVNEVSDGNKSDDKV